MNMDFWSVEDWNKGAEGGGDDLRRGDRVAG